MKTQNRDIEFSLVVLHTYRKVNQKRNLKGFKAIFSTKNFRRYDYTQRLIKLAYFLYNYFNELVYTRNILELVATNSYLISPWSNKYEVFANFLFSATNEYHLARKFYYLAYNKIIINPDFFHNFARLEIFVYNNFDLGEKLLLKAIKNAHYYNGNYYLTYAQFLIKKRYKLYLAEEILNRLVKKSPSNVYVLSTLAQLYLIKNEYEKAAFFIKKAFDYFPPDEVKLELWFYLYSYFPEWQPKAEFEIEKLIKKNKKLRDIDFHQHVINAIFRGHSNPDKLYYFANVLKIKIK